MCALSTKRKRIAVVGTYRSGKTVLLTSMLNHLQYHDEHEFNLDGSEQPPQVRKFQRRDVPKDAAEFNYDAFRDALVHNGTWPRKTKDSAHFVCKFERTDWKLRDVELHWFDFPGERIADIAIAAAEDFAQWSDHIWQYVTTQSDYRERAGEYLELLAKLPTVSPGAEEAMPGSVTGAWKRTLARFVQAFKPLVTPSTFLLDPQGSHARGATPDEIAAGRTAGLTELPIADKHREIDAAYRTGEFAPLPADVREVHPELTRAYSAAFQAYRDEIVMPLFRHLSKCNGVLVCVDVTTILAAGAGMYNDTQKILEDLFGFLKPKNALESAWAGLYNLFGGMYGKLERVAFCATKLDQVAAVDRGRLQDRLDDMTRHISRDLDVPVEKFAVSAIVSTQTPANASARKLIGRLVWDREAGVKRSPSDPSAEYPVSEVPERWPADWPAEQFIFPDVYPKWPKTRTQVPAQIGLNRVLRFFL